MLALLQILSDWIDEIPPLQTPQRFGNLAFRTWGTRLEEASLSGTSDCVSHSDDYFSVLKSFLQTCSASSLLLLLHI
jgi:hypothetical protein